MVESNDSLTESMGSNPRKINLALQKKQLDELLKGYGLGTTTRNGRSQRQLDCRADNEEAKDRALRNALSDDAGCRDSLPIDLTNLNISRKSNSERPSRTTAELLNAVDYQRAKLRTSGSMTPSGSVKTMPAHGYSIDRCRSLPASGLERNGTKMLLGTSHSRRHRNKGPKKSSKKKKNVAKLGLLEVSDNERSYDTARRAGLLSNNTETSLHNVPLQQQYSSGYETGATDCSQRTGEITELSHQVEQTLLRASSLRKDIEDSIRAERTSLRVGDENSLASNTIVDVNKLTGRPQYLQRSQTVQTVHCVKPKIGVEKSVYEEQQRKSMIDATKQKIESTGYVDDRSVQVVRDLQRVSDEMRDQAKDLASKAFDEFTVQFDDLVESFFLKKKEGGALQSDFWAPGCQNASRSFPEGVNVDAFNQWRANNDFKGPIDPAAIFASISGSYDMGFDSEMSGAYKRAFDGELRDNGNQPLEHEEAIAVMKKQVEEPIKHIVDRLKALPEETKAINCTANHSALVNCTTPNGAFVSSFTDIEEECEDDYGHGDQMDLLPVQHEVMHYQGQKPRPTPENIRTSQRLPKHGRGRSKNTASGQRRARSIAPSRKTSISPRRSRSRHSRSSHKSAPGRRTFGMMKSAFKSGMPVDPPEF